MTPTPTVDGDEQLREKIDDLIEQYDILFVTVDGRASFENGIVALIKADKEQAVLEARKEQIMQDFLSLSVNSNEDEVVLIGWRDGQLEALTSQSKQKKGEES